MKKTVIMRLAIICAFLFAFFIPASATTINDSYGYDNEGIARSEPAAYIYENIITGEILGIGSFSEPQDVFVSDNGFVYISDTGNNRIVELDADHNLIRIIERYKDQVEDGTFLKPSGLFVTGAGELYICDTGNNRVLRLDKDLNLIKTYTKPESKLISDQFEYAPINVAVDNAGRIFIVSSNVNLGMIELDANGEFVCFFGAVKTQSSFALSLLKLFTTEEHRRRMTLTLPTEYSSLDIDEQGFIYGTVSAMDKIVENMFISRLNPTGQDVLKRNGFSSPMGDLQYREDSDQNLLISQLNDVVARKDGVYSVLDSRMGRIFTYSGNGEMMYVFGGLGNSRGQFGRPVALDVQFDETYLVVDSLYNWVTVFKPTEYAKALTSAVQLFNRQLFDEADKMWEEALKCTSKSDMVLDNVGRSLIKKGQYKEAMEYLKLTNDREYYSEAFEEHRSDAIADYFKIIITGVIVIILLFVFRPVIKRILKRGAKKT